MSFSPGSNITNKEEIEFNIKVEINRWVEHLKSEPSIIESDFEELKSHLLDLIDELKSAGLDEEEAFIIASKRLGDSSDWENDYYQANSPLLQMRKSLIIFGGILAYFILDSFIRASTKLYFLISIHNDVEGFTAVKQVRHIIHASLTILILFFLYFIFFGRKAMTYIETIEIKPKQAIFMLGAVIGLGVAETFLYWLIQNTLENGVVRSHLFHGVYRNFDFSLPLVYCVGFVVLFFRYHKRAK